MRRLLAVALLIAPMPAPAEEAPPAEPAARMSTLIVFGNDPCPKSSDDEIVVCARLPESDRYRIPGRFRHKEKDAVSDGWVNRAATLDMVSRAGLPDSCSPVGSGGQTGCYRQFRQKWAAEQRQAKKEAAEIP
ncbi:hypothetical protein [Sphingomonas sp. ID0503]|uniref:hypothetical protein n=1 Tax=Sphingomonas sp. ID0503 TaxID=3399691 RepID=UPI003AFB7FB4